MRHIFHEILTRYLDGNQHAFNMSLRELWPEARASWHPGVSRATVPPEPERGRHQRVHREFEPQN
jgi:hypothetical protein